MENDRIASFVKPKLWTSKLGQRVEEFLERFLFLFFFPFFSDVVTCSATSGRAAFSRRSRWTTSCSSWINAGTLFNVLGLQKNRESRESSTFFAKTLFEQCGNITVSSGLQVALTVSVI